MTLLAHAGDWIVNSLYIAPLVIVVAVLGYQSMKDRRQLKRDGSDPRRRPPDDDAGS